MREYDIVLFDIKGYTRQSTTDQAEIRNSLKDVVGEYFTIKSRQFHSISTGDGYYICLESHRSNLVVLLEFIQTLMTELEDIQIRYALHTGSLQSFEDMNKTTTLMGSALSELNRFLTDVKSSNVIFTGRAFYEKYIHGSLQSTKKIDYERTIITHKKLEITDKHGKNYEIYNISYYKDDVEYGFEFDDSQLDLDNNDSIDFEDFKKIVQYAYGQKKARILFPHSQSKPAIHYCYGIVEVSAYTKEYFLFIKNNSNKIQTIDHFHKHVKANEPLTICVNNKYLDEKRDEFWKNDFLKKFSQKIPAIKRFTFSYLDDYIWENCIPESLKTETLFDEEKNYINPEFTVEGGENGNKTKADSYLLKFLKNDPSPIALLKGSGGMGKTTLLKRISDLLTKEQGNQKFVFFIDGQIFAKRYRNEDTQLEKIETLPELLKFYFTTLTQSGTFLSEAPILLNDELLGFVVSSGNVVLIIDGLDEISGFLKNKFDLNTFITDIVNINRLLNHSKILIATRDYYWENEISKIEKTLIDNFKIIDLKGFNDAMAEEYFDKKFENNKEQTKKAIIILKSLTKKVEHHYWPFLVYLVSDIVLKESEDGIEFNLGATDGGSKFLDQDIVFDNIIINFCLREKKRQNLDVNVDEFIELFKEIVIEHQGEMPLEDFKEYVHIYFPSILTSEREETGFARLLVNPLLKQKGQKVMMSVDFIQYHLASVYLSYSILNNKHSPKIDKLLSKFYDGEDEILLDIANRIRRTSPEVFMFSTYISSIIARITKAGISVSEKHTLQKCISTIIHLAFRVFESRSSKGASDRTSLLKDLYLNNLDNIHIYGTFQSLDFSSLKIRNSTFNFYKNILKSAKDEKTLFIDSKILLSNIDSKGSYSTWEEGNFDISCVLSGEFKALLKTTESNVNADFYSLKKDISALLKRFQKSARWIFQMESHLDFLTSSKLSSAELINELLSNGIITNKIRGKGKYNWGIVESAKDSVQQLLHNDHIDTKLEKLINKLYKKYYS